MQSSIRLGRWQSDIVACGFVNNLAPAAQNANRFCPDKELSGFTLLCRGSPTDKTNTNDTDQMGRTKGKPLRLGFVDGDNPVNDEDIEPRNRSVSDSVIFRHPKQQVTNGLSGVGEDSPLTSTGTFGLPSKTFVPRSETRPVENHVDGVHMPQNVPNDALNFFECPKMILSASKPSVVKWTSTPLKKNGVERPEEADDDSPIKTSEASPSGSQSSSPVPQPTSDGENKSDSSRMTFGEGSLSCAFPGCDYVAADDLDMKQHSQNHLMESETAENSNDSSKTGGRPPKMTRCKLCHLEFIGKENLWKHLGEAHFKENALRCEFCPFVTRYRHHFEYHLRNHFGEKPYRCDKCEYKCVNKSMLASHQKSHTNVYQYKCETCGYASKYYHSMKQHIDKTQHKISVQGPSSPRQINGQFPVVSEASPPSGPPNNFSFPSNVVLPIGVQGVPLLNGVNLIPQGPPPPPPPLLTTRLPQPGNSENNGSGPPGQLIPTAALAPPMFLNPVTSHGDFPIISPSAASLAGPLGAPLAFQQFQNALSLFALDQSKFACPEPAHPPPPNSELSEPIPARMVPPPLHSCPQLLRKELPDQDDEEENEEEMVEPKKEVEKEEVGESESPETANTEAKTGEVLKTSSKTSEGDAAALLASLHYCRHCEIYFKNAVTYQCHVGCHNFDEPFKCNRCGHRAADPITFMNHHMCGHM